MRLRSCSSKTRRFGSRVSGSVCDLVKISVQLCALLLQFRFRRMQPFLQQFVALQNFAHHAEHELADLGRRLILRGAELAVGGLDFHLVLADVPRYLLEHAIQPPAKTQELRIFPRRRPRGRYPAKKQPYPEGNSSDQKRAENNERR